MKNKDQILLESLYESILLKKDEDISWELLPPEQKEKYDYPWEILYPKNDENFKRLENLVNQIKKDKYEEDKKLYFFRPTNEEERQEMRNMSANSYAKRIPEVMYFWLTKSEYDMTEDQAKRLYEYLRYGVEQIRKVGMGEYTSQTVGDIRNSFIYKFTQELKQNSKKLK